MKKVYIADTGASHYPDAKSIIWVYDVEDKKLKNPKTFASMEMNGKTGFADGIRCDEDGNVWAAMSWVGDGYDGVCVLAGWHAHRTDPHAGDCFEHRLRRDEAERLVHDRQHFALRRLR